MSNFLHNGACVYEVHLLSFTNSLTRKTHIGQFSAFREETLGFFL